MIGRYGQKVAFGGLVITRKGGHLFLRKVGGSPACQLLERLGYVVLEEAFDPGEIASLRKDVLRVFREFPPDIRRKNAGSVSWDEFRYEMLNRSARCHRTIADRRVMDVVEPLLGEDCHVIANTAWKNLPNADGLGGSWHVDAGPHVPRPNGVPWDDRIPYPIFAIGVHIYLQDCPDNCGPTGVIPGSHRSGLVPPLERRYDVDLEWQGQRPVTLTARAGDVVFFVSDVWHRRMPSRHGDAGRFFLQVHYGRRDIAQRLRTTGEANHVSTAARRRATSSRDRTLIGLHPPFFYDG
jgi:ectoine hydroxylase-related dioxygenase (phytanoyl-CoA dioxygenase family)